MPNKNNPSESITYDCISHPDPFHSSHPIRDSEKQSSFYPEINGFISYKVELRTHKNFRMNLTLQTSLGSSVSIDISRWNNEDIGETLKLLKDLNKITGDAIKFIEKHKLQES